MGITGGGMMSGVFGRCERCGGRLLSGHTCPDLMLGKYNSVDVPTISSLQQETESLRRELAHYKRVLRVIGRSVEDAGLDDKWEE